MKSLTGKFTSVRGWALLLALLLGAGMMISACGDEEVPAPTTPTPPPAPPPAPEPEPTGPATPENVRVTGATSSSITWSWNAVEGVLGYQGQFSPDTTFTAADATFLIVAPATSHTVSNLSGDTTGHFRVRSGTGTSLTNLTFSEWSDGVSGSTDAAPAPPPAVPLDAPAGVRASDPTRTTITVTWNDVEGAELYEVQQIAAGGSWADARCDDGNHQVDDTSCEAGGLTSGSDYRFRVRAVPASSDETRGPSGWTETAAALSTAGRAPTPTNPGLEDDLGVTWTAKTDEISWEWTPVANRRTQYQAYTYVLDTTTNAPRVTDDHPCELNPAHPKWTTSGTETTVYSTNLATGAPGSRFTRSGFTAGNEDVVLFCLQSYTPSEDDSEQGQFGNLSWAWATTAPQPPARAEDGDVTDNSGTRKTTELKWRNLAFISGFKYDLRLASAKGRDRSATDFTDEPQEVCEGGTRLEAGKEAPSTTTTTATYTVVTGLQTDTDYRLCYRAQNDYGESQWTMATATLQTLPSAPNTPGRPAWDTTIPTWVVSHKAGQVFNTANYDATFVTYANNATTPKQDAATCDGAASLDLTAEERSDGDKIVITTPASGRALTASTTGTGAVTQYVFVCLRAKLGTRVGPWAISKVATVPSS